MEAPYPIYIFFNINRMEAPTPVSMFSNIELREALNPSPCILQHQLKGRANPLYLPLPTTLKWTIIVEIGFVSFLCTSFWYPCLLIFMYMSSDICIHILISFIGTINMLSLEIYDLHLPISMIFDTINSSTLLRCASFTKYCLHTSWYMESF